MGQVEGRPTGRSHARRSVSRASEADFHLELQPTLAGHLAARAAAIELPAINEAAVDSPQVTPEIARSSSV